MNKSPVRQDLTTSTPKGLRYETSLIVAPARFELRNQPLQTIGSSENLPAASLVRLALELAASF
jgi:hypothetical protein